MHVKSKGPAAPSTSCLIEMDKAVQALFILVHGFPPVTDVFCEAVKNLEAVDGLCPRLKSELERVRDVADVLAGMTMHQGRFLAIILDDIAKHISENHTLSFPGLLPGGDDEEPADSTSIPDSGDCEGGYH